jgi:hypothetical protein
MRQFGAVAVEDRVAALRAIIQFLIGTTKLTISDFTKSTKGPATLTDRALRNFMRLNSGQHYDRQTLTALTRVISDVVAAKDVSIPSYFRPTAEVAGLELGLRREGPSFLNYSALPTATQNRDVIRAYEGCWRVYRRATGDGPPRINRAFMNIKPYRIVLDRELPVPEFCLYQRIDQKRSGKPCPAAAKLHGALLETNNYITLLGEREKVGMGLGSIGLLIWPLPTAFEFRDHMREITGLYCAPDSEGNQISTYFKAEFLKGSDAISSEEYKRLREDELRMIGSFTEGNEKKPSSKEKEILDFFVASAAERTGSACFEV